MGGRARAWFMPAITGCAARRQSGRHGRSGISQWRSGCSDRSGFPDVSRRAQVCLEGNGIKGRVDVRIWSDYTDYRRPGCGEMV